MSEIKQWTPNYADLKTAALDEAVTLLQQVFYVHLLRQQTNRVQRGLSHFRDNLATLEERYTTLAAEQRQLIDERNDINRELEQTVIADIALDAGVAVDKPAATERDLKMRREVINTRLWKIENEERLGSLEIEIRQTRRNIQELEQHLATCENAEYPPAGPLTEWLDLD